MPGDLLDLILVALAAAFGVAGYRQGFIVGALSFAGFLGGAAVGAVVSPGLARAVSSAATRQALVAIVVVFLVAMVGQLLASLAGAGLRSRVRWRSAAAADAVGGAAVSVVSVLLIAWLIGSATANAPFPAAASEVNGSVVLRGVDQLMPQGAHVMFSDFRRLVANGPYTQVFGALGAEGALRVRPPDPAVVHSAGLARDEASIVKITGLAPSCSKEIEGTGFAYAPGHVLTNAHVVAGVTHGPFGVSTSGPLVTTAGGRQYASMVVLFDPRRDVAVLDVPGLQARPLTLSLPAAAGGSSAIVVGYPGDKGMEVVPARIASREPATGPDIYQSAVVRREIYSVRALVQPGNSGGPLLSPSGKVYGVVFAAAVGVADTGYALTASEVAGDAQRGATATGRVPTLRCDS